MTGGEGTLTITAGVLREEESDDEDDRRPVPTSQLLDDPSYSNIARKSTEMPLYEPNKTDNVDNLDEVSTHSHTSVSLLCVVGHRCVRLVYIAGFAAT